MYLNAYRIAYKLKLSIKKKNAVSHIRLKQLSCPLSASVMQGCSRKREVNLAPKKLLGGWPQNRWEVGLVRGGHSQLVGGKMMAPRNVFDITFKY